MHNTRKRKYRRTPAGAFFMALIVALGAAAGSPAVTAGAAVKTTADTDTRDRYRDTLGSDNSTRYAGRIWTDKTVSSEDITFSGDASSEEIRVERGDADFLITYSALATSQSVVTEQPVDVAFILDISASMCWGTDSETVSDPTGADSRINAMVESLNSAIDMLVQSNENNRIAIAVFNGSSETLPELTEAEDILGRVQDGRYLELTSFSGTGGQDNGTAQVTCNINSGTVSTDGGTNIQAGLYEGMKILADEGETVFATPEGEVTRIPNVVLMSDGAPTTFASAEDAQWTDHDDGDQRKTGRITRSSNIQDDSTRSGSWWNQTADEAIGGGDNDTPHSASGFMALLTASYMKNEIAENYYGDTDVKSANIYTIGFSTDRQTAGMAEMANLVLNPGAYLDGVSGSGTDAVRQIGEAWTLYQKQGDPVVRGKIGQSGSERAFHIDIPSSDSSNPESLSYPSAYFSADSASELERVFTEIVSEITAFAQVPTEISGTGDALHDGYITYTDPIGEYMEVKDVRALIYGGELFERKEAVTSGDTVTYVFGGEVESPVYGKLDASLIEIAVRSNIGQDGETDGQEVTIRIPAAAIPMRINTVTINPDGSVVSNEDNGAYPVRVVYSAGIREGILGEDGTADPSALREEYLREHQSSEGTVSFYANRYSGYTDNGYADTQADGKTVGDASAVFTPSQTNPFYYAQENIPLYTDPACAVPAKGSIDSRSTYYYEITYYEGDKKRTDIVSRSGAEFFESDGTGTVAATGADGQLELQKGAPRLGNLNEFTEDKDDVQLTQTAQTSYYPTYQGNGEFRVYLGNNGVLTAGVKKEEEEVGDPEEIPEETPGDNGHKEDEITDESTEDDAAGGESSAGEDTEGQDPDSPQAARTGDPAYLFPTAAALMLSAAFV